MRQVEALTITNLVAEMCQEANIFLGDDVVNALKKALTQEESPAGKEVLKQLIENLEIARNEQIPVCQDTGFAVFFVEWGQEVHLTGGSLEDAINEGVRKGYREGYLRKSIVADPLERVNTGDNTPAVIYTSLVPGDKVKITFAPKGGGSENMSTVETVSYTHLWVCPPKVRIPPSTTGRRRASASFEVVGIPSSSPTSMVSLRDFFTSAGNM